MFSNSKIFYNYFLFLILFVFGFSGIFNCNNNSGKDIPVIALVNGEPLSLPEFNLILRENRALIYNYFSQKYPIQDGENFWTSNYGDENPADVIKTKTMKQSVEIKIQQSLAKEMGIIEDISYSFFKKKLKMENESRKQAIESKKVIYGPVKFSEEIYFKHLLSNIVIKLKEILARDNFSLAERNLKNFYEQNKNERYQRQPSLKVSKLAVYFYIYELNNGLISKQEAENLIQEIKMKIDDGINFESFENDKNIAYEIQVFNDSTAAIDEKTNFQLKTAALLLSVGEYSRIIEEKTGFFIIKCLSKKDGGNIPFDEIKSIVSSALIEKKYRELIEELIADAEININHAVYDSVRIL